MVGREDAGDTAADTKEDEDTAADTKEDAEADTRQMRRLM